MSYHFTPRLALARGGDNVFDRCPARTCAGSPPGGALPYDDIAPIGIKGAFHDAHLALTFRDP